MQGRTCAGAYHVKKNNNEPTDWRAIREFSSAEPLRNEALDNVSWFLHIAGGRFATATYIQIPETHARWP
jgi:hypothetical protein